MGWAYYRALLELDGPGVTLAPRFVMILIKSNLTPNILGSSQVHLQFPRAFKVFKVDRSKTQKEHTLKKTPSSVCFSEPGETLISFTIFVPRFWFGSSIVGFWLWLVSRLRHLDQRPTGWLIDELPS